MTRGANPWLFRGPGAARARDPGTAARLRLFALPFAGGGGAVFHGLARHLHASIDLAPIVPPGRERRLAEPPLRSMDALVEGIERALGAELEAPFALLGHSLGALVAFELARRLRARGAAGPTHLFVCASRAPHVPSRRTPIHALCDEDFLAEVERLGGMPPALLEQRELVTLLLPALRADFEVYETWRFEPGPPLDCPISALAGADDDAVALTDLDAWRDATRGPFALHVVPGGHFFLHDAELHMARVVNAALATPSEASQPAP